MTRRQEIIAILEKQPMSIYQLAQKHGWDFKTVIEDLEHIKQSIKPKKLEIIPAKCKDCGFLFNKRKKIKKPSKCPRCRGERILSPLFRIK